MNCKNCGAPLNDDAKFCGSCGTKVEVEEAVVEETVVEATEPEITEPEETEEVVEEVAEEVSEEAVEEEIEVVEAAEETTDATLVQPSVVNPQPVKAEEPAKEKKPINKTYVIGGVAAVLVVALLYYAITGLSGMFGGSSDDGPWYVAKDMPLFYMDNDDLYAIWDGDKEGTEIVEDYYDSGYVWPITEKDLYYIDNGDLYFKSGKKDSVEVDDDVIAVYADRESTLSVYFKDNGEMYVYDGKDTEEIADDVMYVDDFELVANQKKVVIMYTNEDYETVLIAYVNGEVVELADKANFSLLYVDNDKVIYSETDDWYDYEVVQTDYSGEDDKLFSFEGDGYVDFNSDGTKALYIDVDELTYYDGKDTTEIEKDVYGYDVMDAESLNAVVYTEDGIATWIEGDESIVEAFDDNDYYTYDVTSDLKQFVVADDDYELVVYTKKGDKYEDESYDVDDIEDIRIMDDNRTVMIIDDNDTLFRYKIGDKEAEEILDDVYYFTGYEANNLMIRTDDDELFYYNGSKAEEVASDVTDYYRLNLNVPSYSFLDDRGNFYYGQKAKEAEEKLEDVEDVVNYNNEYIYLLDDKDEVYLYKAGDKEPKELDFEADGIMSFWQLD